MRISVTIDDKMMKALDTIAARENRSRSNMINQLIKNLIMVEEYKHGKQPKESKEA